MSSKFENVEEWEDHMLALPIAGKISGEHDEHQPGDPEFIEHTILLGKCKCDRCRIIRIKRRRAFRFPRRKCPECGNLFVSLFEVCDDCLKGGSKRSESS